MSNLNAMLAGAIMVCAWAISVFFVRFWKRTGDSLFVFFAIAFFLLGVERLVMSLSGERRVVVYLIRLCGFLLIILGVLAKNQRGKASDPR